MDSLQKASGNLVQYSAVEGADNSKSIHFIVKRYKSEEALKVIMDRIEKFAKDNRSFRVTCEVEYPY
jgi:hypothetical protein